MIQHCINVCELYYFENATDFNQYNLFRHWIDSRTFVSKIVKYKIITIKSAIIMVDSIYTTDKNIVNSKNLVLIIYFDKNSLNTKFTIK
jgi:hypothetical protein